MIFAWREDEKECMDVTFSNMFLPDGEEEIGFNNWWALVTTPLIRGRLCENEQW